MAWSLPELPLPPGRRPEEFPIPDRLNVLLSLAGFAGAVGLLWVGSLRAEWWWALGWGVVFSYEMLFVYALIHQGQHDTLHSDPRLNYLLGVLLTTLFPTSFTMVRTTHQGHHLRNRTDYEMFDLYYETDHRFLKTAQFYCILVGLFWPIIPIGALLAAVSPKIFRLEVFKRGRGTGYLLGDIRESQAWAIRAEVVLCFLFFAGLILLLGARWQNLLVMYACFSVNWSTRQYVTHAFTRRDVVEGALNLRTGTLMSWLLLRGEWDLEHHRYPALPWPYLPDLARPEEPREDYLHQYLRQWAGPRLCREPAPESQQPVQLSVWESGRAAGG